MPILARLRGALLPKDPLYRRESGAGRRTVLVAKLVGFLIILGAYLAWSVLAPLHARSPEWTAGLLGWAVLLLCVVAFVLGVQAVRSEVTGGTAEALVMTPVSRWRLIVSKLGGSVEFIVIAALLAPLYCFTMASMGSRLSIQAMMHGGTLRVLGCGDSLWWTEYMMPSLPIDVAVGLAGWVSDVSWYALLAACGMLGAVMHRGRASAWLTGGFVALLAALSFSWWDSLGFGRVEFGLDGWLPVLERSYYPGWDQRRGAGQDLVSWVIIWYVMCVALRLAAAYGLARLAARHFDLIATG